MNTDLYISQLAPPVRDITQALCRIIRESPGGLTEQIKWSVPVFSNNRNICSVIAHTSHVNLQFFQGAHIAAAMDLEGTGRDMRHLKFRKIEDIQEQAIVRYLQQAIEYDSR